MVVATHHHGVGVSFVLSCLAAGFGAGLFNGVAGGGTMLSFPTLLALGISPITANISSTIGILPGYLSSIHGFREEISRQRHHLQRLIVAAMVGGLMGAALLLTTSTAVFKVLVVVLVGLATVLFALQPLLARAIGQRTTRIEHRGAAIVGVTVTSLYGGYFGAGMGIMLLVVFGLTLPISLAESSGLRSVLSIFVNALAAFVFLVRGTPNWVAVACLAPGSLLGGSLGARLAKRLPVLWLRIVVVTIGVATTVLLATKV
jgi:uncharacterized membrane protein YfcA